MREVLCRASLELQGQLSAQLAERRTAASRDQFYTRPDSAKELTLLALSACLPSDTLFFEPDGGNRSFCSPFARGEREVSAIDIEPKATGIRRGGFLTGEFIPDNRAVVVLGNPPFGFASNTAIKFSNKAANRARVIAFIVPRTFRKQSVQNCLDAHFHLRLDRDIPKHAFIKDGQPHDVPCAFQIWEKQTSRRKPLGRPNVSHLISVTTAENAHFCLRRVGGRAGQVLSGTNHTASTTYFIREEKRGIRKTLETLDWKHIREQTAGVRSGSKREIAQKLLAAIGR